MWMCWISKWKEKKKEFKNLYKENVEFTECPALALWAPCEVAPDGIYYGKKVRTLHCLFLSALCWLTIRWSGYLFLRIQSKWSNKSLGVPCSIASFQHQPQQLCICAAVEKITWAKKVKKEWKKWTTQHCGWNILRLRSILIP